MSSQFVVSKWRLRQTVANRVVSSSTLEINRVNDNVLTTLQSASFPWSPNKVYQIQFSLQGNTLVARATAQFGSGAVSVSYTDGSGGAITGDGLAGLTASSVATRFDNFFVTDNATPTSLGVSYAAWKFQNFGNNYTDGASAGDNADPDRDGLSNLHEYALAGDPNVNTQSNLPGQSVAGNALQLAFTRRSASEAAYTVQASDDLAAWTDVAVLPSGGSAWFGAATVTETGGGSTRAVVVRDAESLSNHRQRFLRLRVSVP